VKRFGQGLVELRYVLPAGTHASPRESSER
jgi:hypothetical protein